jgi:preprotein translocase subunit SecD
MVIRALRFNIYFLLCGLLVALTGCQTAESKRKQQLATLRIHLESNVEMANLTEVVTVSRAAPMAVNIVRSPFLNESTISSASLVEDHGGFSLKLEFNNFGRTILEQYSGTYQGQRFAIRSQFGVEPDAMDRWIGAPRIARRIKDGVLIFTPDATRAEAEQIVLGLNNHAEKSGEQMKP